MEYNELKELVREKKVNAILVNGQKLRLFISTCNQLCHFKNKSRRTGYPLFNSQFEKIEKVFYVTEKTQEDKDKQVFKSLSKYRKYALKANFKNCFIDCCLSIPETFEEWVKDGKKSAYQYGVTTGNKIDGKIISISRIEKKYPNVGMRLRDAIENKTHGLICSRYDFAGYEMSIETTVDENGNFRGFLSLEYRNCGNGYYYLLINDENFIGYDVD
jgi:hypothetical protein